MISVIIPTRNEEKNLPELLESLKTQDYHGKVEILVVDRRSTDRTREIARKYKCEVILQKKLGISNARNIGWKNAKGDVLIFLEADSKVNKEFLKEIKKVFRKKRIKCARPFILPVQKNGFKKL